MRLRWNTNIVHETIDGEVLAIHNDTGTYYSLVGTGAEVWSFIDAGAATEEIVDSYVAEHPSREGEIRAALSDFFDKLVEERLAEQSDEPPTSGLVTVSTTEFAPPTVDVYSDMQDLLLFDPIHEVEPSGWPNIEHG